MLSHVYLIEILAQCKNKLQADFEDFYTTNSGTVLSIVINKCTYVTAKERFEDMAYSKKEIVDRADSLEHELVREIMKKVPTFGYPFYLSRAVISSLAQDVA